jgi:uncharacterized protein (TIGR03083 family)
VSEVGAYVAAWRQTVGALGVLAAGFGPAEWSAPTECPQWSVKDVYAHVVGGELWMAAGHPLPAAGVTAIADASVAGRRAMAPAQLLDELGRAVALREWQLEVNPPDPDAPAKTAFGLPVTEGVLQSHRAFDIWVHEQDVRRAVGQPGNLGTDAARVSASILTSTLPWVVAKRAGAPPGSVLRVRVGGDVGFDHAVTVDPDGRARLGPWERGPATATLDLDWETFLRLATGRAAAAGVAVTVSGDRELAGRVLAQFAVTP